MATNNLLVVDSMTIYSWEYFTEKSNGFKNGVKVIMHAHPVCVDPFTGERMMDAQKKPVLNMALEVSIPFYTTDVEAAKLIAIGEADGTQIIDHENCKGWIITGETIPPAYKYAFTNMGLSVKTERYEFGTTMFKVRKDRNGRIRPVLTKGRPTFANTITIVYYEGEDAANYKLDREHILHHELSNWQPTAVPDDDEDENGNENGNKNSEPSLGGNN